MVFILRLGNNFFCYIQELDEIKNLIKAHNDESNKSESMKDTLLNNGYTFCDICDDYHYEPDDWFHCAFCYKDCCYDCNEDEGIIECDVCYDSCCKDCIYDYKNYYHLCHYCLRIEAKKTIKFNSIFRKYLCKITVRRKTNQLFLWMGQDVDVVIKEYILVMNKKVLI